MRRSALLLHGRCGLRRIDFHMRDQLFRMKSMVNSRIYRIIDFLLIIKPQFHLCRMDIHIHMLAINLDVQYHKRIFMLHGKVLIRIFDGLGYNAALYISSVDEIILKIPVSPRYQRLSKKSSDFKSGGFVVGCQQIGCNLSAIYMIDDILKIAIAGSMQLGLPVIDELEGDLRVGQCHSGQQIPHMARLCHRSL